MKRVITFTSIASLSLLACIGCSAKHEESTVGNHEPEPEKAMDMGKGGTTLPEGNVTLVSEVNEKGEPKMLGFKFDLEVLDKFPTEMNPDSLHFDINGNGKIEMDLKQNPPLVEMLGDYAARIEVPEDIERSWTSRSRF